MFKELGALIDAAGEVAAKSKSLRISANAVKEALSDKDGEGEHLMGCLVENSDRFRDLKEYKSIIVNVNEVDEDE